MALAGAAWEQGVPPVGTSVADQNPDFLEAVLAYRGGVHERKPDPVADGEGPETPGSDPFAELDAVAEAQRERTSPQAAAGRRIAPATGRRRKARGPQREPPARP